jgi:hypothetical protein
MHVTFTKCDVDILKLLSFDQLHYVMLHYVTFPLCYPMFRNNTFKTPLKLGKYIYLISLYFRSEKIEIVMPKAEGERVKMRTITGNWINKITVE